MRKTLAEYALSMNHAVQVLEREDCEKMGMGLYLGVAECSALPPKFIHLTYTPEGQMPSPHPLATLQQLHMHACQHLQPMAHTGPLQVLAMEPR